MYLLNEAQLIDNIIQGLVSLNANYGLRLKVLRMFTLNSSVELYLTAFGKMTNKIIYLIHLLELK